MPKKKNKNLKSQKPRIEMNPLSWVMIKDKETDEEEVKTWAEKKESYKLNNPDKKYFFNKKDVLEISEESRKKYGINKGMAYRMKRKR